jgi:Glycosyl hydrolases family 32 C terminal
VREPRSIVRGGLLPLARDEPLRLHLYVDRSLVEVYANERLTTTERAHPTRQDSTGIVIDATGGAARLLELRISTVGAPAAVAARPATTDEPTSSTCRRPARRGRGVDDRQAAGVGRKDQGLVSPDWLSGA